MKSGTDHVFREARNGGLSCPDFLTRTLVLLLLGILAACVPTSHTIAPYDKDSVAAQALESRASAVCAAVRGPKALPPHRFTTDGCSLWPDSGWQHCCIEHDIDYWCGGSAVDRCAADRRLRACVKSADHETAGSLMYAGVRVGGHPWWPFPWRWGYGWDWPYSYDDPVGRVLLRGGDEGCAAPATESIGPGSN